jgi:molybdopterin-guanine dinucleotide biosynthesis adapter protein
MTVFSIAGWSGSGKTTLIEKLIATFRDRGKRVVAVKKVHGDYALQPIGKDSQRFAQAGAETVFLLSPTELLCSRRITTESRAWEQIWAGLEPTDVVLLEGMTVPGVPLIEVFDSGLGRGMKFPSGDLAAVVSDAPPPDGVPGFGRNAVAAIADFMEAYR